MEIIVREERIKDYELSEIVVKKAFRNVEQSDHKEHYLVSRLRKTNSFIPELSIVAEFQGEIVGHENYYPRFGFKPASKWGIKSPFDVLDESFMALELKDGSLDGVAGTVVYAKEFFE